MGLQKGGNMDTYIDAFVGNKDTVTKFELYVFSNGEKLIYKINDFNCLSNIMHSLSERSNLFIDIHGIGLALADVLEKEKIPFKSIKINHPVVAK